ncbi:MAG TPA: hypothetical protein VF597_04430, partial [Candidatus Saccharimonadales bacterium]
MTTNDFYRVASLVQSSDYKAVFDLSGSATTVPLKRQFRLLAQHVQPETVVTSPVHDAATDVMQRLTAHYQAAQRASQGKVDELRFTTSSGTHVTTAGVAHADMATCFLSTSTIDGHERSSFVKLAATTRDNDLLAAEATALTKLATDGDPARAMFYPQLLDSFAHLGHERLRGNVLARLDGFYNLVDVKQAYPRGVHPLDMTWM